MDKASLALTIFKGRFIAPIMFVNQISNYKWSRSRNSGCTMHKNNFSRINKLICFFKVLG